MITADIIQPIHAGAGSLYSIEYFELARAALKPGGLMLQWVGHREASHYKLIARTFSRAFPEATAWANGTLLVGTVAPFTLDVQALARELAQPAIREAVLSVGVVDVASVLRLYTAGPAEIRAFVGEGAEVTDDQPLLEYHRSLPPTELLDLSALRGDVSRILPRGDALPRGEAGR